MKKFTDSLKWQDPWFRKLSGPAKLLWFYLLDQADPAGVVDFDCDLASADCRIPIKQEHFVELGNRVQSFGVSKVVVTKFIPFQYGRLSDACYPHKRVFEAIAKHGLEESDDGSWRHPGGSQSTHHPAPETPKKAKTAAPKDALEIPADLPADVADALALWQRHRREIRKPITPTSWQGLIRDCRETPKKMTAAMHLSIKNGWQGLFPDKVEVAEDANTITSRPAWLPDNWKEIAIRLIGDSAKALTHHSQIPAAHQYEFEMMCRDGGDDELMA